MQGRIVGKVNLLLILLLSGVVLVSCGGGGGGNTLPPEPVVEPTGTINGIGFDGLLINSDVKVYDWSKGTIGALLGTTKTDNSGKYSLDLATASTEILVVLENGFYIEEASGKQIQLDPAFGHKLTAVAYYTSGQPITISATFFSTLAHGLAESYIADKTFSVSNAIIEANRTMSNWAGFDITTTTPLDVANVVNITTSANISDGHKYGFVSAAISELTLQIHLDANVGAHTTWPSIAFVQLAYQDIQDGILDGKANGTQLSLGLMNFDANIYRDLLATKLLQFTIQDKNKVGLGFDDLKPFAMKLNSESSAIFNNTAAPDIATIKPAITNLIPTMDSVISNTKSYPVSAIITDTFGIKSAEYFLGADSVSTPTNLSAPNFSLDVTPLSEGVVYPLKLVTTNIMNNSTETTHKFTVSFSAPDITTLTPVGGTSITGNFDAFINATDVYGISTVQYYIDSVLVTDVAGLTVGVMGLAPTYKLKINSAFLTNGTHTFETKVTNTVNKVSSLAHNVMVTNGNPSAKQTNYKSIMVPGGWSGLTMCKDVPIEITDTNNVGIASVNATWYTNYIVSFNLKYNGTFSASLTPTSNVGNVYLYHLTLNPQPIDGNDYYYPWNAPFSRVGDRFSYGFFKLAITDNAGKSSTFKGYSFRNAGGATVAYCGYY